MFQKLKPWRSEPYLDWIRSRPCLACDSQPPAEPHHIIGVGGMSGMGMKAPDWAVIPLCRECHNEMHDEPGTWFAQWQMIVRTLGAAIDAGKLQWRK